MQAVILAAGKSTRTYPLTLTRPKPLLKVADKAILEYSLEAVKGIVDEIIIVIGYKKGMIKDFVQKNYPKLKVKFVEQKEQLGTGHAASILKDHIKDRFILLLGDNIYSKSDIKEVSRHRYSILVKEVDNPEIFGIVFEEKGMLKDIIEKPKNPRSNLVNCGLLSLDKAIFPLLESVKKSQRGEYELTDALKGLSKKERIYCIKTSFCPLISYPEDLPAAERELKEHLREK